MQRENRRKEIYKTLQKKYEEFKGRYRETEKWLRKGGNVPALREELRKKDKELLASVEQLSALDWELKRK